VWEALFDEKGESDLLQDNEKCRISLTAMGIEKCLTMDRDNQATNGDCVGMDTARVAKIGNAAPLWP
jgi:hypothetical protein